MSPLNPLTSNRNLGKDTKRILEVRGFKGDIVPLSKGGLMEEYSHYAYGRIPLVTHFSIVTHFLYAVLHPF